MFGRYCSLFTVLTLLVISPVPVKAFWNREKKEEATDGATAANVANDSNGVKPTETPVEYGVDVSFPMHRSRVSNNYAWLPHNMDPVHNDIPSKYKDMPVQPLGDRQTYYDEFLNGCKEKWGASGAARCQQNEDDRIAMTLRQPQSMQNYTDVGFKKIRAPQKVFKLIKDFWDANKEIQTPENWGKGNTYTNNWDSATYMVSVENGGLRGGGAGLKKAIWDAARETIQEWTGEELTECSLYGIRVYTEGSILAPHVDRLPLVSSAIINVAQDVDEPWVLEVYGHDGKATNVTMEPGDMVLYESHSVIHGRPYPLKGRYYANIFIHFEPTGHSLRHNSKNDGGDVHEKYRDATARGAGGHEVDQIGDLPSYIQPGSPEESNWRMRHPHGSRSQRNSFTTGSTPAHLAAQKGDLKSLAQAVEKDKSIIHAEDENGWKPIHEASRGGHTDVVKFLYKHGADVNARTSEGAGGTPLWWAQKVHGDDHPTASFLESIGALSIGPEL
jgi:prolyl 4-hydroxylase